MSGVLILPAAADDGAVVEERTGGGQGVGDVPGAVVVVGGGVGVQVGGLGPEGVGAVGGQGPDGERR